MKHIQKYGEPQAFIEWKALANADWQPSYADLSGATKQTVKEALMADQGYLCCYCERRLTDNDSHIEHFRPQRDPAVDPLDYDNLLCSCQQQLRRGEPRHCGNLKDEWFDETLLVSPLSPDCEGRLAYTGQGLIKPAGEEDAAAAETITRLGLAIPKLNALRSHAIEPFLDDSLSPTDLTAFVTGYLAGDGSGRFSEFWSTIRYLFGSYAPA